MFDRDNTDEQKERHSLVENRRWLNENFPAVQKDFSDQWVAILDRKVAANHQDVETVKEAVAHKSAQAVVIRIPSDKIPTPI